MIEFVAVLDRHSLRPGECRAVAVGEKQIALYNVNGEYFATANNCVHKAGPLGDGELRGHVVVCPWHAWSFDVRTGENTVNTDVRIPCFEVRVVDDEVQVRL